MELLAAASFPTNQRMLSFALSMASIRDRARTGRMGGMSNRDKAAFPCSMEACAGALAGCSRSTVQDTAGGEDTAGIRIQAVDNHSANGENFTHDEVGVGLADDA